MTAQIALDPKGLLTTMVTAGALDALGNSAMFNGQSGPAATGTNGISTAQTAATFGDKLLKNVTNNVAGAAIDSAINGKPLDEKVLSTALTSALITTGLASGANAIGDARVDKTLNDFTQKVAHAVLGCAGGAATGGGCAAGAVGAVIGEMTAEYAKEAKLSDSQAVALAKTLSAASGVLVGGGGDNVGAVNTAATTGANAAENNYLKHAEAMKLSAAKDNLMGCSASDAACRSDALGTIKQLESQDKTSNAALEAACASPSSPACAAELVKVKAASDSYIGQSNGLDQWGVVSKDGAAAKTLAVQYTLKTQNAGLSNAITGAGKAVAGSVVGAVELAAISTKAAAGDPQAQAQLGQMVKATGDFIGSPVDSTQKAVQDTLNRANQLEAAGQVDAAQQMRAELVTNGLLVISGSGALVVKGAQTAARVGSAVADSVAASKAASAAAKVDAAIVRQATTEGNFYRDGSIVDIGDHFGRFENGASVLAPTSSVGKYPSIGRADGLFVTSPAYMDNLLQSTGGNNALIKQQLGIEPQYWNEPLTRIDIPNPLALNPRLPSGLEAGANSNFIRGGFTSGGAPEIVIDPVKVNIPKTSSLTEVSKP